MRINHYKQFVAHFRLRLLGSNSVAFLDGAPLSCVRVKESLKLQVSLTERLPPRSRARGLLAKRLCTLKECNSPLIRNRPNKRGRGDYFLTNRDQKIISLPPFSQVSGQYCDL